MITVALLAFALQTAEAVLPTSLAYRFLPGTKAVYTLEVNSESSPPSNLSSFRDKTTLVFERSVLEPDSEGRPRLQVVLKSAKISSEATVNKRPWLSLEYDSEKSILQLNGDDIRPYLYPQLIDRPVAITLGQDNRVLTVEGKDEIIQKTMAGWSSKSQKKSKSNTFDAALMSGAMSGGYAGAAGAGLGNLIGSAVQKLIQTSAGEKKEKYMKIGRELSLKMTVDGIFLSPDTPYSMLVLPNFDPGHPVQPADAWRKTWDDSAIVEDMKQAFAALLKDSPISVPPLLPQQKLVDVKIKTVEANTAVLTYSRFSHDSQSQPYVGEIVRSETESGEVTFNTARGLVQSLSGKTEMSVTAGQMVSGVKITVTLRLQEAFSPAL